MSIAYCFVLLGVLAVPGDLSVETPSAPISPTKAKPAQTLAEWTVPSPDAVRTALDAWIAATTPAPDSAVRERIEAIWTALPRSTTVSGERLDTALRDSMRIVSAEAATCVNACDELEWNGHEFGAEIKSPTLPQALPRTSYLYGTLRLYHAQSLLRTHFFDEALAALEELSPQNTVDPAAALIAKGIACNRLLRTEEAAETLKQFWAVSKTDTEIPRRYTEIAKLIEADIEKQKKEKEDDLQSIARRMDNVKRRLGNGRTDRKTQDSEKDILEALDKTIEKIEQQMKECDGNDMEGRQSNNPAKDSKIMRQKAPGEVHEKELGDAAGWGDLPPKEREEALLRMEKEFPSHYRAIIESYFREMAQGKHD